jgi:chromosomal replication initiator protein
MEVIAQGVTSNIRELEGSFTRVLAHAALTGEKITLSLARKVLTEVFKTKDSEINPSDIKKAVANYYKIKVSEMESPKRSRNIAYPRQISIYLIRELCPNYSFPKIGEIFGGRDHTTILHSYEKIVEELETSPDLNTIINNIKSNMGV